MRFRIRFFRVMLIFVCGMWPMALTVSRATPALPVIPTTVFNVTARGAVGDGATDNTAAIQATINAAISGGGGVVLIPAAAQPYLCGPLALGSKTNLQVADGAVLQMQPYGSYQSSIYTSKTGSYSNFISATGVHDVAITGGGRIEGDGAPWWTAYRADSTLPHRPYMVRFTNCTAVLISGPTFANSPSFHLAFSGTNDVTIDGVTITAPGDSMNTDGIDPAGSRYLMQNCNISVGDDNIAVKPGGTYCSDMLVTACAFGTGHGMSIGGQSNKGLNGLTVTNCTFNGTSTGLRMKADATQGGVVQNVVYSDLTMTNVPYPIVFYSYYNQVGSPGATSGSSQTTPAKVASWNATPPNALNSTTLPVWKNITVRNLTATGASGYSIIWGLPLADCLIAHVTLDNVRISGGKGLEIYDATDVQVTGDSSLGGYVTYNALAITGQPTGQQAALGGTVTFAVGTAGRSGVTDTPPAYRWMRDGVGLTDGTQSDGTVVSGATTAFLTLQNVQAGAAGDYAVTVSNGLDIYNTSTNTVVNGGAAVSATSETAALEVLPIAVSTPVVMDERFADGEHETLRVPDSAGWSDSQPADTLTDGPVADGAGAFVITTGSASSSSQITGYFTEAGAPVTLEVGEKLTVKLTLAFAGLNTGNPSKAQVRGGIFDSLGDRATFAGDRGYGLFFNFTQSGGPTNPFAIYRRTTVTGANLFAAGADFSQIGGTGGGSYQNLADGTDYALTYTVERTGVTTTRITTELSGGGIGAGYCNAVTETSSDPVTAFDYVAFRIASMDLATTVTVKGLRVEHYPLAPAIATEPAVSNLTVGVGGDVTLPVGVSGSELTYQWIKDGVAIDGGAVPSAVTATLRLTNVQAGDAGNYLLLAGNAGGLVASDTVAVTVVPLNLAQWRTEHFSAAQLDDVTISGPAADAGGTGLANLLCYAFGLDPWRPDPGRLPGTKVVKAGEFSYPEINYTRRIGADDVTCVVQSSTDLSQWGDVTDGEETVLADGAVERVSVRLPQAIDTGTRRFLRVKVTGP